ncbi:MAG: Coenzyme F420 hydrogenase/dehydrogenase, beta subunit C-terminal domain [Proteobacteria bacterium]|nr:Coenzyme F420 hydrogenase/dehydrogenase, beta subunit C-terminal domain [Pseudomonadota bacterium]MBU1594604.1 Coenzyme F420 hydrogenase/dehydrogenase, beta subunit C-terminal domain [Pseudomonadota bacterium]
MLREAGASGGLMTAVLSLLLEQGRVDAVVSVGFDPDAPLSPRFLISRTTEELRAKAGSVYCHMRLSGLEQLVVSHSQLRLAVVCQPCHVAAVRKLQSSRHSHIQFVFSFFCGYNMEFEATAYLLRRLGIPQDEVARIEYRGGPYPGGFQATRKDGRVSGFGKECYELVNLRFLRKGCGHCRLYMGEGADLALGDAWLRGRRNLNVALARTPLGLECLRRAVQAKRIDLYRLSEQDLVLMHLHNLRYKKYGHSRFMRSVLWVLRDFLPEHLIPFGLLISLSRLRRRFKIGIEAPELVPADLPTNAASPEA